MDGVHVKIDLLMEFSGRLTTFSMGDLLQWAGQERRSGALVLRRSRREKRIYLAGGRVVACLSDDPAEHYGEHLLLHGHLKEAELIQALTWCSREGKRLAEGVVVLELLTPEEASATHRERVHDAVCDTFLWPRGVFVFENETVPEGEALADPWDVMSLTLEGTRWIDELARMRQVLVHDQVVLRRGPAWPPQDADPLERRVARAVEDGRSLEELYRETRGSYFRFLEAAYRLCLREVLDIATVGSPRTADTVDLSIADLLLEQASAEERTLLGRRRLGVPLDVLERLHPRWVQEPGEDELEDLSEPLARLARRADGGRPLGALLDEDPELEGRQLDWLQLELRRGRMALLPGDLVLLDQGAEERSEPLARRWWRKVFRE